MLLLYDVTFLFVLAGLCRGCHREEESPRSGKGRYRRTATKIQGEVVYLFVTVIIIVITCIFLILYF